MDGGARDGPRAGRGVTATETGAASGPGAGRGGPRLDKQAVARIFQHDCDRELGIRLWPRAGPNAQSRSR